MTSTLAVSYVTRLPELDTNRIAQLKLSVAWWELQYHEAFAMSQRAWKEYQEIIDEPGVSKATIDDCFALGQMFEDITQDAWQEWQTAKQNLLAAWG